MKTDMVILADGDFPSHPLPLETLRNVSRIIACDGAAKSLLAWGREPDWVVGDLDSLDLDFRQKLASRIIHVSEQETNDLTKAFTYCCNQGWDNIVILGATGKREDHTIGNISLLIEYLRMGADVWSYTDYGVFIPCRDTCTFQCSKGQKVSIFNFTACKMKSEGLAYPIYDFTSWWQGTLNHCVEESFTIEAKGEYLLYINYK